MTGLVTNQSIQSSWQIKPYSRRSYGSVTHSATPMSYDVTDFSAIRHRINVTVATLQEMKAWPENWDGHNSSKPNSEAISNTAKWLSRIFITAQRDGLDFLKVPLISADEAGNVSCEWWYKNRKLAFDFYPSDVVATKIVLSTGDTPPSISDEAIEEAHLPEILSWLFH